MISFRKSVIALLSILVFFSCAAVNAQDAASIQQKLIAQYPLTKASADKTDIVTAGAVLVLEKDNLLMYTVTTTVEPQNTYKNGKISQGVFNAAKKCKFCAFVPGVSSVAAQVPNVDQRTFVAGEKFWVTGIEAQDDGIVFKLLSDPYNDVRYYSMLKFPFTKGSVPPADTFISMVAEVIKVAPADDSGSSSSADKQSPASGTPVAGQGQSPAPQPAQTAMAPIPPPPPPPDAPPPAPKTIAKGQTKDVVVAILGQPSKVVKLGSKEIDVYPDMKVTFVNNKVTDVE
jgi:hypothetical protein